jgi:transcriptional regulator with XRE-family HTH domain
MKIISRFRSFEYDFLKIYFTRSIERVIMCSNEYVGGAQMSFDRSKLVILMARSCMNNSDLCKSAGIPCATLSQVRRGTRSPRPKTIGRIALALGVDPAELLNAKEER